MNFKFYLKAEEYPLLNEYILLLEYMEPLNERGPKPQTLEIAKELGKKLGFKVKPSDTIFDYLKSAGRGVNDLFRLGALYLSTDVKNRELRRDLVKDMKNTLGKVNKREVAAFIMQLDRASLGITSHIRHALMSLLGIEVTTYNQWLDDKRYIQKELSHIKDVLDRMDLDPQSDVWKAYNQFKYFMDRVSL